jgi:hypothetical protein
MNKQSPPQHKSNRVVDFAAVKAASISAASSLVSALLPRGHREGDEWIALNPTRHDTRPGSFKVNLLTGVWSDFATGDKGADPIDLYLSQSRVAAKSCHRDQRHTCRSARFERAKPPYGFALYSALFAVACPGGRSA